MPITDDFQVPSVDEINAQSGLNNTLRGQSNEQQGLLPPELEYELSNAVTTPQMPSVLTPESQAALGAPDLEFTEHYAQTPPVTTWSYNNPEYKAQLDNQRRSAEARLGIMPGQNKRLWNDFNSTTWNVGGKEMLGSAALDAVRRYQDGYLKRYMALNNIKDPNKAIEQLKKQKNRWYDLDDPNVVTTELLKNKRFQRIANGQKTVDNIKWYTPGQGWNRDGSESWDTIQIGQTYDQAMDNMNAYRAYRAQQRQAAKAKNANPSPTQPVTQKSTQAGNSAYKGNLDPRIDAMTSDKNTGDTIRNRVVNAPFTR